MIVTYSPKYKAYQRSIRSKQIERAEKIAEEEMYDVFYAVITNLEDNVDQILRINKQH